MRLPDGVCLFASVCNTTANAAPISLWLARGESEYLVDLSALLSRPGDTGLTGLAWHDGTLYAAVQSASEPRIIMLNGRLEPLGAMTAPAFADLHSLLAMDGVLLAAATGTQSLLRLNLADRAVTPLCQSPENIHLNSACYDGESLLICYHRRSAEDRRLAAGGVMDVATRRILLHDLGLPHSLMPYGDGCLVLDSVGARVICFDRAGPKVQQTLDGFLRGATRAGNSLFVASSTLRYISRSNPKASPVRNLWDLMTERVRIFELDAATLDVRTESAPVIPGFEIYELLAVPGDLIDPPAERLLQPDRNAVAHLFYDAAKRAAAAQNG
ncbi:MAG TPA: DUF4915 domain-containing protein [Acetobacteraceae bacterium]